MCVDVIASQNKGEQAIHHFSMDRSLAAQLRFEPYILVEKRPLTVLIGDGAEADS